MCVSKILGTACPSALSDQSSLYAWSGDQQLHWCIAVLNITKICLISARGKLSIAQKPEVHPKIFKWFFFFKNLTLQILNFIPVS